MIIDPYTWSLVTIESIDHITDDTLRIRLAKPDGYQYYAGQYAIIRVQHLMRQYSFTSQPSEDYLDLLIQREPNGAVTGWFHDVAKPGDTMDISQAFGNFTLPEDRSIPLLFVAGRVGVAPCISLILAGHGYDAQLLYSVRTASQICYPDLMSQISASIFVTNDGQRIDEVSIRSHLRPDQVIYLCGSKRFVDGISQLLASLDVPAASIKRELFTLQ